jgi:TRAP transporter 4TM/12TM fusion protein
METLVSEDTLSQAKVPVAKWWKDKQAVAKLAAAIAIGGSLFHLYVAGFGSNSEMGLRSIHWTIMSVLIFLLFPLSKNKNKFARSVDMIFLLCALAAGLYNYFEWPVVVANGGFIVNRDVIFGIVMVIVVMEASRRVVGLPMTIIVTIFLLYAFFGQYLPGVFSMKGFSLDWIINVLYMSPDGIFGMPLGVSASYIVLFVLFGSFLQVTGGGKLFTDLAFALVGRAFGGPAKAAVVSSGLMGMLSGSAAANVATVGTFTIPLMKKSGYQANTAAAIEACSSTGGQFMPPVMGAAAFIIAENLGISYGRVALAAIIPAVLYYLYLYLNVDLEARKHKIARIKPEDIPSVKTTLKERGHLLLPLALLIVLMSFGYSPGKSVFWSIIFLLIAAMSRKTTRLNFTDLLRALEDGILGTIPIAAACAAAGIIGGVISLSGLGLSFSSILISLAGKSVFLLLILTMIASIILGMGLPTTACYIILAILTAPALTGLGANPLAVHFFIFFFGCISTITPPVALAAYTAAGIAKSNPMKTGYSAFRMGFMAFVIPFIAFYSPGLLFVGSISSTLLVTLSSSILLVALAYVFGGQGFKRKLTFMERMLFLVSAGLIIIPHNLLTLTLGVLILAGSLSLERLWTPAAMKNAAL